MKKVTYNVYSSMLGGYISMGHLTRESAKNSIKNHHCRIEAKQMTVSVQRR